MNFRLEKLMMQASRRFLRLREVVATTGYKRSALYEKIKTGDFPKPYHLGARAIAWLSSDIDEWIETRIKARGD